jgi:Tfp pilus assembly protein PilV
MHEPYYSGRTGGLSLIETVITVALFTALTLAVATIANSFYTTRGNAIDQAFALQSARTGTEAIVRDIREAAFADNGAYPLDTIDPNEIVLYADRDRDASVEQVRYFLDGTALKRGVVDAAGSPPDYSGSETISTVAEDVRNANRGVPVFAYYKSGSATSTVGAVTDVGYVTVTLVVNVTPSEQPKDFTLSSSASLRNVDLYKQ